MKPATHSSSVSKLSKGHSRNIGKIGTASTLPVISSTGTSKVSKYRARNELSYAPKDSMESSLDIHLDNHMKTDFEEKKKLAFNNYQSQNTIKRQALAIDTDEFTQQFKRNFLLKRKQTDKEEDLALKSIKQIAAMNRANELLDKFRTRQAERIGRQQRQEKRRECILRGEKPPKEPSHRQRLDEGVQGGMIMYDNEPVNKQATQEATKAFISRNKNDPSLMFFTSESQVNSRENFFPNFEILPDKIIQTLEKEPEESSPKISIGASNKISNVSESQQSLGLRRSNLLMSKSLKDKNGKKIRKLIAAKWDEVNQQKQIFRVRNRNNKQPETMPQKEFEAFINDRKILSLEKFDHYFERSPSLEVFQKVYRSEQEAKVARQDFLSQKLQEQEARRAEEIKEREEQDRLRLQMLNSKDDGTNGEPERVFKTIDPPTTVEKLCRSINQLEFIQNNLKLMEKETREEKDEIHIKRRYKKSPEPTEAIIQRLYQKMKLLASLPDDEFEAKCKLCWLENLDSAAKKKLMIEEEESDTDSLYKEDLTVLEYLNPKMAERVEYKSRQDLLLNFDQFVQEPIHLLKKELEARLERMNHKRSFFKRICLPFLQRIAKRTEKKKADDEKSSLSKIAKGLTIDTPDGENSLSYLFFNKQQPGETPNIKSRSLNMLRRSTVGHVNLSHSISMLRDQTLKSPEHSRLGGLTFGSNERLVFKSPPSQNNVKSKGLNSVMAKHQASAEYGALAGGAPSSLLQLPKATTKITMGSALTIKTQQSPSYTGSMKSKKIPVNIRKQQFKQSRNPGGPMAIHSQSTTKKDTYSSFVTDSSVSRGNSELGDYPNREYLEMERRYLELGQKERLDIVTSQKKELYQTIIDHGVKGFIDPSETSSPRLKKVESKPMKIEAKPGYWLPEFSYLLTADKETYLKARAENKQKQTKEVDKEAVAKYERKVSLWKRKNERVEYLKILRKIKM